MSINHTVDQLRSLGLIGMAEGFTQQTLEPTFANLHFDQRVQMMVSAEVTYRDTRRYKRIIRNAKLKVHAMPEDIDYRSERGLDRAVVADLLTCGWIERQRNVIITGATGTGKTWLSCALAVQAARKGMSVIYKRISSLLDEMAIAHEDRLILKKRSHLAKMRLLILDDFGLTPMSALGRSDLLEVLEDRVETGSTIVLGQMPVKGWYDFVNDPAVADAILDRLKHGSVRIELVGNSMRGIKADSGQ